MYVYHLIDEVAERFLTVIDALDDEIDELEDDVEGGTPRDIGRRLRALRHDLLGIRRTLRPSRDAVRKIVDNRIELDDAELFPRDIEIAFGDAYDKLLRASEGLDAARDALAGVRDYLQGKISNDQNEVMKRLTLSRPCYSSPRSSSVSTARTSSTFQSSVGASATGGRGA